MILALGIVSAIALGTLNGILIAEAMYGRWPWDAVNDGIEQIGRWIFRH
jgi:hypothetical protein